MIAMVSCIWEISGDQEDIGYVELSSKNHRKTCKNPPNINDILAKFLNSPYYIIELLAIIYGMADTEKRLLDKLPNKVKSLDDIFQVHKDMKDDYTLMGTSLRNKLSKWKLKRQITKIEENKDSTLHKGAKGEIKVLEKLSELNDDFHVMCGLNIDLGKFVSYDGEWNLRSAQMDYVIISKLGVVLIEVKNWSPDFIKQHKGLSPYEQVDRAGRVLWITIQDWIKNPSITSVLLSLGGNFQYNSIYKFVNVKNRDNINTFIQSRYEKLSEKEVKKIVNRIKKHVTT